MAHETAEEPDWDPGKVGPIYTVSRPGSWDPTIPFSFWKDFFGRQKIQTQVRDFLEPIGEDLVTRPVGILESEKVLGVATLEKFHQPGAILWLHRDQFAESEPTAWISIESVDGFHFWQRIRWKDRESRQRSDADNGPFLSPMLSRGYLYAYADKASRPSPEDLGSSHYRLQVDEIGSTADVTAIRAWLNPLVIRLDQAPSSAGLESDLLPFLEPENLLDVIPSAPAEDLARILVHADYAEDLSRIGEDLWSWVDRILGSSSWDRVETPFLVLDRLGGTFSMPDPTDPSADHRASWADSNRFEGADWRRKWLIEWCCRELGLGIKNELESVPRPRQRDAFHRQRRRYLRIRGREDWSPVLDQLRSFADRARDLDPRWTEQHLPLWQSLESMNSQNFDSRKIEPEGGIEDLVSAFVRPRSLLLAALPSPSGTDDSLSGGEPAVELIESNLVGELGWIAFLLGKSNVETPPSEWSSVKPSWGRLFFQSMFCRPPLGEPVQWLREVPCRLGDADLGGLVLGGGSAPDAKPWLCWGDCGEET